MLSLSSLFWAVFITLIALITLVDARTYKIPNKILIVLSITGVVSLLVLHPEKTGCHLLAAAITLVIGYALYSFTGFGAGDAKFFSAITLWFGVDGILPLLYWFGICCAFLVVVLVVGRRLLDKTQHWLREWRPLQKDAPVPLALAIGPAAIATWLCCY